MGLVWEFAFIDMIVDGFRIPISKNCLNKIGGFKLRTLQSCEYNYNFKIMLKEYYEI